MVRASVTLDDHHDSYLNTLQDERNDITSRSDAVRTCIKEHRNGTHHDEDIDEFEDEIHDLELTIARLETANEHLTARTQELSEKNSDIEMIRDTIQRLDSIPIEARQDRNPELSEGDNSENDADEPDNGLFASLRGWFSR